MWPESDDEASVIAYLSRSREQAYLLLMVVRQSLLSNVGIFENLVSIKCHESKRNKNDIVRNYYYYYISTLL